MTISRINTPSDATWQRAWEVADAAELATLLATYLTPLGPKRGDVIVQLDDGIYYLVLTANVVKPINLLETDNTWLGDNTFDEGIFDTGTSVPQGDWQAQPYDAGEYTGAGTMTWTVSAGQAAVNRWMRIRHTLFWNVSVVAGVVGGTPTGQLRVTIPNGWTGHIYQDCPISFILDAGVAVQGFAYIPTAGDSFIAIERLDGAAFTAGNVSMDFNVVLEIDL